MHGWETRMRLKHYLDQGVTKAELSRRFGIARRTIHYWIETGQLDRDLAAGRTRQAPRRRAKHKLDPFKGIIDDRLREFPQLSARRLFDEVRAAGYPGGYGRVNDYVRRVRPCAPVEPVVRYETPPGRQGQVDVRNVHAAVGAAPRASGGARPLKTVVVALLPPADDERSDRRVGERVRLLRRRTAGTAVRPDALGGDADLNEQAKRWLDGTANVRRHGTTGERPLDRFERDERGVLGPLAGRPYRRLGATQASAPAPRRRPTVEVQRRSLNDYAEAVR